MKPEQTKVMIPQAHKMNTRIITGDSILPFPVMDIVKNPVQGLKENIFRLLHIKE